MQDAAAADHAAGGNDEARRGDVVDGFGFVGGAREMELVNAEGIAFAAGFFADELESWSSLCLT